MWRTRRAKGVQNATQPARRHQRKETKYNRQYGNRKEKDIEYYEIIENFTKYAIALTKRHAAQSATSKNGKEEDRRGK